MISIIIGTNRKQSVSEQVAKYYKALLDRQSVTNQILNLESLPADFAFTALYSNVGKNEVFNILKNKMETSDKFVFIVPEYNGSFPGVLKTFIDGLSYPNALLHKKAALVGISTGVQGGALALSHLTDILNYLGLTVLAQKVKIPHLDINFVDGKITDPFIEKLATEQVNLLINF
jgi:chromate reductase, NAD(P)H dehydrogenase (quinone)